MYTFHKEGIQQLPLEINKYGKLESKILDDILEYDTYISRDDDNFTIRQMYKSQIPDLLPVSCAIKRHRWQEMSHIFIFDINGEQVKVVPYTSPETYKIASILPHTPGIGALSTIPYNSDVFKYFFPLYQDEEKIIFKFSDSASIDCINDNCDRFYRNVEAYLVDYTNISVSDVKKTLYSLLAAIYPLCTCKYFEGKIDYDMCHEVRLLKSENYLENAKRSRTSTASYNITELTLKGIKKDWIDGSFMEWYAAEELKKVGFHNTLWCVDIQFNDGTIHLDSFGYNEDTIVLLECKRVFSYDNPEFQSAVNKLRSARVFFQKKYPDKKVYTGVWSNIRRINSEADSNIDFHINHTNFSHFENILKKFLS